jgi:hypothetical protein
VAAAHHNAVVEGAREIELGEVRAHGALLGPEELDEALRVEEPGGAEESQILLRTLHEAEQRARRAREC